MLEDAKRIDPLSLLVAASRAAVLLMARRVGEAELECRRALELDANFWRALVGRDVAMKRVVDMKMQSSALNMRRRSQTTFQQPSARWDALTR